MKLGGTASEEICEQSSRFPGPQSVYRALYQVGNVTHFATSVGLPNAWIWIPFMAALSTDGRTA